MTKSKGNDKKPAGLSEMSVTQNISFEEWEEDRIETKKREREKETDKINQTQTEKKRRQHQNPSKFEENVYEC